jgi:hypothetical protein
LETLFLFGALFILDHMVFAGNAFDGIQPNPYWIPVTILALSYGTGPGLVAAAIAISLWAIAPHDTGAIGDELQVTLHLSLQPLLWVVTAVIIGEVTGSRHKTINVLRDFVRETEENQQLIADELQRLSEINRALQIRITTKQLSVGHAMEAALGLLEKDREAQIAAVERLAALGLPGENFTYLELRGHWALARFRSGRANDTITDVSKDDLMRHIAACARPLDPASQADAKVLASQGQVAIPAHARGVLVGMLMIRDLPASTQMETIAAEASHVAESLATITEKLWGDESSVVRPNWLASSDKVA